MALSDSANELYDRQIRLWGAETQAKLGKAEVLVVGMDQVGMDLAKNLVLSGCKLTLFDKREVTGGDVETVFLYRSQDEGVEVGGRQAERSSGDPGNRRDELFDEGEVWV